MKDQKKIQLELPLIDTSRAGAQFFGSREGKDSKIIDFRSAQAECLEIQRRKTISKILRLTEESREG